MTKMTMISPERILQLGTAFWASKTLLSAVELGLFTEIAASGPMNVEELRTRLDLHPRAARDFFDALVALGMLERLVDGSYANTPESELYLDRDKPSYVGGILAMSNERLYPFWAKLTDALRTGAPQSEARTGGPDPFAAIYAEPNRLELFLSAMTGVSLPTARAMATAFPWQEFKTFADIGCAQGALPVEIARAHPHLTGSGFDLPAVQPVFESYIAKHGLAERLVFQPGDFFSGSPPLRRSSRHGPYPARLGSCR
jgi:hypothetical protein